MFLLAGLDHSPGTGAPPASFTCVNIHTFSGRLSRTCHRCRAGARGRQGRLRARGPKVGLASEKLTWEGFLLKNPQIDYTPLETHTCLKTLLRAFRSDTPILYSYTQNTPFYLYLFILATIKPHFIWRVFHLLYITAIRSKASIAKYSSWPGTDASRT